MVLNRLGSNLSSRILGFNSSSELIVFLLSFGAWLTLKSKTHFLSPKSHSQSHQQRTCDSYFPNSLWPISYLGYMCFKPENLRVFFVEKAIECSKPWRRDSQCQDGCCSSAEKKPKCPKTYWPNLSAQAKSLGYHWKKRLHWAFVVCAQS